MATSTPQIAAGFAAGLGYQEEVSYGLKPVTLDLKTCRMRSNSLGLTKAAYQSEEKRLDRQSSSPIHGMRSANGDIVTEISVGGHSDFYKAILGGVYRAPATVNVATAPAGAAVTVTSTDDGATIGGFNFATSNFIFGDPITFTGTGTALDNHVFTLAPGVAGAVLVSRAFNKAVLPITTTAGTMKMKGGRAQIGSISRSYTMERPFVDIGSFIVFTGETFNAVTIDLPPSGIATSTFSLMGRDASPVAAASIDGVAEVVLTAATLTNLNFNGTTGVITAGAGSFVTAGFAPGDKVVFDGNGITAVQNRNVRTVVAVTASTLTVAEAIQTGGPYTAPFTVTRVGLPLYLAAPEGAPLVAVSGIVAVGGVPVGTVTSASITIDNQMGSPEVVGSNVAPVVKFGAQSRATASLSVLFDRGGTGSTMYNAFDQETDVSVIFRLDSPNGLDSMTISLPRCKPSAATIADEGDTGLPVSVELMAYPPLSTNPMQGTSQIAISDTSIAAPAVI